MSTNDKVSNWNILILGQFSGILYDFYLDTHKKGFHFLSAKYARFISDENFHIIYHYLYCLIGKLAVKCLPKKGDSNTIEISHEISIVSLWNRPVCQHEGFQTVNWLFLYRNFAVINFICVFLFDYMNKLLLL